MQKARKGLRQRSSIFPYLLQHGPKSLDHSLCLKINKVMELKGDCSPRMLGGRVYSARLVGSTTKGETTALCYGLWLPATVCSSILIGPLIRSVLSSYQNTCGASLVSYNTVHGLSCSPVSAHTSDVSYPSLTIKESIKCAEILYYADIMVKLQVKPNNNKINS